MCPGARAGELVGRRRLFPLMQELRLRTFQRVDLFLAFGSHFGSSDSLCTHVTLHALSFCPFEQHCCFRISGYTNDQVGVQMETLFVFLAAIRSKRPTQRNGNRKMTTRATSTAKKARTATGHDRSPELQRLRVCKQLRTTGGVPHANPSLPQSSWQPFLVVQMCQRSSGCIQQLRKVQYFGDPWAHQCLRKPVFEILFIQYSLASFPDDYLCRTLMRRSNLATRKTFRPHETVFQLG